MTNEYKLLSRGTRLLCSRKSSQLDNGKPSSISSPRFMSLWCSLPFLSSFCFSASWAVSLVYTLIVSVSSIFQETQHRRCKTSATVAELRTHGRETTSPGKAREISFSWRISQMYNIKAEEHIHNIAERSATLNLFPSHYEKGFSNCVIVFCCITIFFLRAIHSISVDSSLKAAPMLKTKTRNLKLRHYDVFHAFFSVLPLLQFTRRNLIKVSLFCITHRLIWVETFSNPVWAGFTAKA